MWFGTDNGASRFDGYEFKTFDARSGLAYNVVLNIMQDNKGRVHFGTLNCQAFFVEGDSVRPYQYNHLIDKYRDQFIDGSLLYIDASNKAYFKLTGCGILSITQEGEEEFIQAGSNNHSLIYQTEQFAVATSSSCLGKAISPKSVFEIRHGNKSNPFQFRSGSEQTSYLIAHSLGPEQILFGSEGYLHYSDSGHIKWSRPFPRTIHSLLNAKDKGIWIGLSHTDGLRYYTSVDSIGTSSFQQFIDRETITAIYQDKDGGIWAAGHDSGIFYCANKSLQIYGENIGLPSNTISAVSLSDKDLIHIGLPSGELVAMQPTKNRIEFIPTSNINASKYIYDLVFDKQRETLWSCNEFFRQDQIFKTLKIDAKRTKFSSKRYHLDRNGKYLYLVSGRHFTRIQLSVDPNANEGKYFKTGDRILSVYSDAIERLWIASNSGLNKLQDDQIIHSNIPHPAFQNRIEDIDAFDGYHLIFGTKGRGVVIWKNQEEIIEITTEQGLASNMIEDVHVDENGIAWIATFNGLSKIEWASDWDQPLVRSFGMDNGLPSNEIYQIKSYQGQPWLCTAGGLVRWEDPTFDSTSYTPTIRTVLVNGEKWDQLTKLKASDNNISFDYLTINFQQFGKIPYRYRLHTSHPWTETMSRQINYAKLSPGEYQFEVQSQNEDGVWSLSARQAFEIIPPWFATSSFYLTCLLITGLLGYLAHRHRLKRQEEKFKTNREIEHLKKQAMQAQMNPHFVFNCLNSIQSLINNQQEEEANRYLVHFSKLMRGSLNASLQKEIPLTEDIEFIRHYLELEQMRFFPKFEYTVDIDPSLNTDQILIDPMLVLPFAENAVVHGISQLDRMGQIKISYNNDDDWLVVHVMDNGTGLHHSTDSGQSNGHRSVGISLTRKRLELNNASNQDWVNMRNITDEQGQIVGTDVVIRIKIKQPFESDHLVHENSHR